MNLPVSPVLTVENQFNTDFKILSFLEIIMLFRFQFQYLHAGLISQLKFSCFSPTTIPHNHNICIHEIQCQSFHKSNSNQQKNPHWGYTGLSQAIEESAEDQQSRFRQRDHHSNVYGFGVPVG